MAIRDFTGKIVLVTGAASGIGRETALAFARAGADRVVCDLNASGLEAEGGRLISHAPVSSRDAVPSARVAGS